MCLNLSLNDRKGDNNLLAMDSALRHLNAFDSERDVICDLPFWLVWEAFNGRFMKKPCLHENAFPSGFFGFL
jgi:hypothetical protein